MPFAPRFLLPACLALAACGDHDAVRVESDAGPDADADADPRSDANDALFDPGHIVDVRIEMAGADWDALRTQTRSVDILLGEDCTSEPFVSPFTEFPADVTIDGVVVENVAVRKKGFLGSLDENKPSLKIDFDEYVDGQEFGGVEVMTLNNSRQDPSFVRQCLAYEVFRRAGVPAPRCNFARVTVNGSRLGIYAHVETASRRYLRRHFPDDSGLLFEGTLSDFREGWTGTFEQKTRRDEPNNDDILALKAALEADDDALLDALAPLVDVDAFLTFWATEVLVAHTDGYANNTNNFYLYDDPSTGRFVFLPWGVDNTLHRGNNFGAGDTQPAAVYATGMLARRLYLHPDTRAAYFARLEELLASVWDEGALLAEVNRMAALVAPDVAEDLFYDAFAHGAQLNAIRAYVVARRAEVRAAIEDPPAWDYPERPSFCFVEVGNITATFETMFGTLGADDLFAAGSSEWSGTLLDATISPDLTGAAAGFDPDDPGRARVLVIGRTAPTRYVVLVAAVPWSMFTTEATIPLGIGDAAAYAGVFDTEADTFELQGVSWTGALVLDEASITNGDEVAGSVSVNLVSWPF